MEEELREKITKLEEELLVRAKMGAWYEQELDIHKKALAEQVEMTNKYFKRADRLFLAFFVAAIVAVVSILSLLGVSFL